MRRNFIKNWLLKIHLIAIFFSVLGLFRIAWEYFGPFLMKKSPFKNQKRKTIQVYYMRKFHFLNFLLKNEQNIRSGHMVTWNSSFYSHLYNDLQELEIAMKYQLWFLSFKRLQFLCSLIFHFFFL